MNTLSRGDLNVAQGPRPELGRNRSSGVLQNEYGQKGTRTNQAQSNPDEDIEFEKKDATFSSKNINYNNYSNNCKFNKYQKNMTPDYNEYI